MPLRRRVTYAITALTLLWAVRLLAAARPAHTDAALDELARDVDRTEFTPGVVGAALVVLLMPTLSKIRGKCCPMSPQIVSEIQEDRALRVDCERRLR